MSRRKTRKQTERRKDRKITRKSSYHTSMIKAKTKLISKWLIFEFLTKIQKTCHPWLSEWVKDNKDKHNLRGAPLLKCKITSCTVIKRFLRIYFFRDKDPILYQDWVHIWSLQNRIADPFEIDLDLNPKLEKKPVKKNRIRIRPSKNIPDPGQSFFEGLLCVQLRA